jgi:hypothetical protein
MTTHQDVLARIVGELAEQYPDCGILVAGSLMRGTEHARSDIDLFAVFPDIQSVSPHSWRIAHATPTIKAIENKVDGVPVFCTCIDLSLLESMMREPWRNRLFARAKVIRDPAGAVARCQGAINEWFRSHPNVDELWDRQEQQHQECKAALRRGEKATMEFPSWDAFADHVDRFVRSGRV